MALSTDIRRVLPGSWRPMRMATLVGLLAVTGMRIGEALALDDGDFDRDAKVLTVRRAKFGKSRLIPLHPTTSAALQKYALRRSPLRDASSRSPFFPSPTGKRLLYGQVHWTFGLLLEHDRKAFEVTTLLQPASCAATKRREARGAALEEGAQCHGGVVLGVAARREEVLDGASVGVWVR